MSKTSPDTSNAVVKAEDAALPAHLQERMGEVAGMGNSQASEDNTLPFIGILQKGSPQVNKQEPEYIKGAEAGHILNSATGQLWSGEEGVPFIPCGFTKNYVEWIPRTEGGGYVDTHPFGPETIRRLGATTGERGLIIPSSGHQLVETVYTFGLLPGLQQAVIGATSSALKPMRDWMSLRNSFRAGGKVAPAFSRSYQLRTVYQKNDKGDWFNWKISDLGWVLDSETFEFALEFARMIDAGSVRMGRPTDDMSGAAAPGTNSEDGVPL